MPASIITSSSSNEAVIHTIDNAATITQNNTVNTYDIIVADGDITSQIISSGTTVSINQQGIAEGNTVQNDAILNLVSTTGNNTNNIIQSGGTIIANTAPMVSTHIQSGGTLNLSYTSAQNTVMDDGATMNLYQGAVISTVGTTYGETFNTGTINLYEGASIYYPSIQSQGILNIHDGATALGVTVQSGGKVSLDGKVYTGVGAPSSVIYISNGGTADVNGGSYINFVSDGGILNLSNLSYDGSTVPTDADGVLYISPGAIVNLGYGANPFVKDYSGGTINIYSGASISSFQYNGYADEGTINIYSGGSVGFRDTSGFVSSILYETKMNVLSGGSVNIVDLYGSGIITVDGYANTIILGGTSNMRGGSAVINSGGVVDSLYVNSGSAVFSAGASLTGTLTLENTAHVTITTSTGGIVDLVGDTNSGLTIYGSAQSGQNVDVTTVINDFSGIGAGNSDSIILADVNKNDVTTVSFSDNDHITLTLSDNSSITLNIPNIKTTGYYLSSNDGNGLTLEVCFLTGTMIEIPEGLCAIEDLKVNDLVLTYDPLTKTKISSAIKWIGHKKASINPYLFNDTAGYPVRISKNAIAQGIPNKDLLITPEHCLFFDGMLIPARMLVNGYSIFYDTSITHYNYYHIETEEHSILTADGMLTESYLDTGNRHTFNHDHKVIELSKNKTKTWEEDAIAPLTVERSIVEAIYNTILQRAFEHQYPQQTLPFDITHDPDLYLITDRGEALDKKLSCLSGKVSFIIPNNVNSVWIISKTSRPCDTIGAFVDDRRNLGVLIGDITLQRDTNIYNITTHIEPDHLSGWDRKETISCRWTKGKALLPLQIESNSDTPSILTLTILSNHSYLIDNNKRDKESA